MVNFEAPMFFKYDNAATIYSIGEINAVTSTNLITVDLTHGLANIIHGFPDCTNL